MRDRMKGDSDRNRRPLAAALLLLVLGLTLGNLVAWLQGRSNDARIAREFDTLTEQATRNIVERFHLYEYGLRGMRGSVLTGFAPTSDVVVNGASYLAGAPRRVAVVGFVVAFQTDLSASASASKSTIR